MVEHWSNLDFRNVPLTALMRERLPGTAPILLENDANAAALGEYAAGAGQGSASMLAITLGTGVGGGAVLGGKLYTGFNYAGMEVGHFVLEHGGRPCTCGRRGCFETYCSATALIRRTREEMEQAPDSLLWTLAGGDLNGVNGRTAFDGAARGDHTAVRVVVEYIRYLACGITSLVNIFQPEVFCVGGGVANQGRPCWVRCGRFWTGRTTPGIAPGAPACCGPGWGTTRVSSARPCSPGSGKYMLFLNIVVPGPVMGPGMIFLWAWRNCFL